MDDVTGRIMSFSQLHLTTQKHNQITYDCCLMTAESCCEQAKKLMRQQGFTFKVECLCTHIRALAQLRMFQQYMAFLVF